MTVIVMIYGMIAFIIIFSAAMIVIGLFGRDKNGGDPA